MKTVYFASETDHIYVGSLSLTEPYCEYLPTWTDEVPPAFGKSQTAKLVNGKWELIPDYRFTALWPWDESHPIDVGHIRAGMSLDDLKATDIPPPDAFHDWDMKTMSWKLNESRKLAHEILEWEGKVQTAIRLVTGPIELHQDQQALIQENDLSEDLYKTYLAYRVALRQLKPLDPIPPAPEGLTDG